jgi:hypothetical protein
VIRIGPVAGFGEKDDEPSGPKTRQLVDRLGNQLL